MLLWMLNKYSYFRILRIINENKIDIIHTNNSRISVGYEIAKYKCIKHVWHLREFMDLDFNMRTFKPFRKLCADFNNSDSVICVSEAVKNHFYIENKNSVVLYDAVDSIQNVQNVHYKKENYFLYCGSLAKRKVFWILYPLFQNIEKLRCSVIYSRNWYFPYCPENKIAYQ